MLGVGRDVPIGHGECLVSLTGRRGAGAARFGRVGKGGVSIGSGIC